MTAAPALVLIDVLNAITTGVLDDHLSEIAAAVQSAKERTARLRHATIRVGDRFRIDPNIEINPVYLRGKTVTVREVKISNCAVDVEGLPGKRYSRGLIIPTVYLIPVA